MNPRSTPYGSQNKSLLRNQRFPLQHDCCTAYVAVTGYVLDLTELGHGYAAFASCSNSSNSSRTRSRDFVYSWCSAAVGSIFLRKFVCQANSLASSALISNDLLFTTLSYLVSGCSAPPPHTPVRSNAIQRQVPYGVRAQTILHVLASENNFDSWSWTTSCAPSCTARGWVCSLAPVVEIYRVSMKLRPSAAASFGSGLKKTAHPLLFL